MEVSCVTPAKHALSTDGRCLCSLVLCEAGRDARDELVSTVVGWMPFRDYIHKRREWLVGVCQKSGRRYLLPQNTQKCTRYRGNGFHRGIESC